MLEKTRSFLKVLRAVALDRSFFNDVRTIAFETRENRTKIEELRAELQRLGELIQQFFQELKAVRQELSELREVSEQERQKIMRRIEQIEQGLPPEIRKEDETDSGWVM